MCITYVKSIFAHVPLNWARSGVPRVAPQHVARCRRLRIHAHDKFPWEPTRHGPQFVAVAVAINLPRFEACLSHVAASSLISVFGKTGASNCVVPALAARPCTTHSTHKHARQKNTSHRAAASEEVRPASTSHRRAGRQRPAQCGWPITDHTEESGRTEVGCCKLEETDRTDRCVWRGNGD